MQTNTITRRAMLGGTAAACLAAPAIATPHPDAELLALWELYKDQWRFIDTLPHGDCQEREDAYAAMDATADRIEATQARSGAGIAIKLRIVFMGYYERAEGDAAIMYGATLPENGLLDCRDRMLWKLIEESESMTLA
ncbi:MAG TPA: hypothetical protein VD860_17045 [Azospirillum sp.]|nr:hypothetical protein [Azospirillum sp.]